jgi:hypothetical protein
MSTRADRAGRRIAYWVDAGRVARAPTRWQLAVGWLAQLPVYLSETELERAASRRTRLGQVPVRAPLQALYAPGQAWLGTGLAEPTETVVRHLLSVFHEDGLLAYDLQLLAADPDGLATLERRARAVAEGTDRWSRLLVPLVGGDGYHQRLAQRAAEARAGDFPGGDTDARFASLVGFLGFCLSMPDWPPLAFYGFEASGA